MPKATQLCEQHINILFRWRHVSLENNTLSSEKRGRLCYPSMCSILTDTQPCPGVRASLFMRLQ